MEPSTEEVKGKDQKSKDVVQDKLQQVSLMLGVNWKRVRRRILTPKPLQTSPLASASQQALTLSGGTPVSAPINTAGASRVSAAPAPRQMAPVQEVQAWLSDYQNRLVNVRAKRKDPFLPDTTESIISQPAIVPQPGGNTILPVTPGVPTPTSTAKLSTSPVAQPGRNYIHG